MSRIIRFFLALQTNLKLYHWQTMSYARHIASDKAVEKVSELADEFMEVYIGKYGRPKVIKVDEKITLENHTDDSVITLLKDAVKFVNNDIPKLVNPQKDGDLINILDELLAALNQTLYLFTLH